VAVTELTLFDKEIFDSLFFDTKKQVEVEISEAQQMFDPAIFDSDFFDDNPATAYIRISDALTRIQNLKKTLTDSFTTAESATRIAGIRTSIADSWNTITETLDRLYSAKRELTKLFTTAESVTKTTPTTRRDLYEGFTLFDEAIFDPDFFDTDAHGLTWTESLTRKLSREETLSETWNTLTESLSRLFSAKRSFAYSYTTGEVVTRLNSIFRSLSDSFTTSESLSVLSEHFRSFAHSFTTA